MTLTVYTTRLFGGQHLGVTYDSSAGTLTIAGQSVTLSLLSAALQATWSTAISGASSTMTGLGTKGAFGGDNIAQAVGAIIDATPTWRAAIQSALTSMQQVQERDLERWTN